MCVLCATQHIFDLLIIIEAILWPVVGEVHMIYIYVRVKIWHALYGCFVIRALISMQNVVCLRFWILWEIACDDHMTGRVFRTEQKQTF
jgi:hypothetical protein